MAPVDRRMPPGQAPDLEDFPLSLPKRGKPSLERNCLVTVGATAPFTSLLQHVLSSSVLSALISEGFTNLIVQCGSDSTWFPDAAARACQHEYFRIESFDFVADLSQTMTRCCAVEGERETGVVICHAGTGTILDALRVGASIIVVPNPTLKDNHQLELAEEIQRQGYGIHSSHTDLPNAIRQSTILTHENATTRWAPHNTNGSSVTDPSLWMLVETMLPHADSLPNPVGDDEVREGRHRMAID